MIIAFAATLLIASKGPTVLGNLLMAIGIDFAPRRYATCFETLIHEG
jgi:hypothetical protein